MVEFAGWFMPVHYGSVIDEHHAVRQRAGLFDVSHMGEVVVRGDGAESFLQGLTPNDVSKLAIGRAHYSGLLTPEGTYLDDLLIYRRGAVDFLVVVNAANRARDWAWIEEHARGVAGVEVQDVSDDYALLALQGPAAPTILAGLTQSDLETLRYYGFVDGSVAGRPALVSRTGYTGEDGFELYLAPEHAEPVWEALLEAGGPHGLVPAGLGARDTLRLEASMALYGHELDDTTTPWEAGLAWVVKLEKGDFVGRDALVRQKASGAPRRLIGFEVTGRGIAREGHPVRHGGAEVGRVTSGTFSPTYQKALGMAYVPSALADLETGFSVEVRGREIEVRPVPMPFYKRSR